MIEPEIIICEGKWAFDTVTEKILKCPKTWQGLLGYTSTKRNPYILGYKRNQFGQIIDKELIGAKIKEIAAEKLWNN